MSPHLVFIVGPTGSGKSELALELATACGGEIVSADSQQVYRYMDIGTGKVSRGERERVPHHLIDVVDPDEEMTAQAFADRADRAVADCAARGTPVIVCGGTGLYVRAFLLGLFAGPPADPVLRARLASNPASVLWDRLAAVDPESAGRIARTDEKRLVRALEVYELTGLALSEHHRLHNHKDAAFRYPCRIVALGPERPELYRAIDARVDAMLEAGLVDEVRELRRRGYGRSLRSQQAIGYAESHSLLEGAIDEVEAIRLIKRNSRRYARRQLSWWTNGSGRDRVEWYPRKSHVDLESLRRYLIASRG